MKAQKLSLVLHHKYVRCFPTTHYAQNSSSYLAGKDEHLQQPEVFDQQVESEREKNKPIDTRINL